MVSVDVKQHSTKKEKPKLNRIDILLFTSLTLYRYVRTAHMMGGGGGGGGGNYWAIQAGLLTPLTFARHRLSPLAAFTSGAYFFTMEGGDSEFANFTLPTLKAIFFPMRGNFRVLCPCLRRKFVDWDVAAAVGSLLSTAYWVSPERR